MLLLHRVVLILAGWATLALPCAAQQTPAEIVARWVDEETLAVGIVDLEKFDGQAVFDQFAGALGFPTPELKPLGDRINQVRAAVLESGGKRLCLIYSNQEIGLPALIVPIQDASKAEHIASLIVSGKPAPFQHDRSWFLQPVAWKYIDGCVVIASPSAIAARETMKPAARPDLEQAMKSQRDAVFQAYLIPSASARKVFGEMMPTLPKELGGGSSKPLTEGLKWASFASDLSPRLSGTLKVQAADAAQARELEQLWLKTLASVLREASGSNNNSSETVLLNAMLRNLTVEVKENQLILEVRADRLEAALEQLSKQTTGAYAEQLNATALRNFIIAVHNYHNDYAVMPSQAICDKEGKPLLSWRVTLLPYLGEDHLYKQFKLDEPWDSEHNKKLLDKMPAVYKHPFARNIPAHHTVYQVFYSKRGTKPAAAIMETGRITLGTLATQDGTSNTFLVTDAAEAVPWTKPADLLFDGTVENLPKLASPRGNDWAQVGFCDGSVRTFKTTAKPKLLWQLIGRNDGFNFDVSEVFK